MEENLYTTISLENLLIEEKRLKKNGYLDAVLIGFVIGILIYGVVTKGIGFIHIFLPILLLSGIYKGSLPGKKKLKLIQGEIKLRNQAK